MQIFHKALIQVQRFTPVITLEVICLKVSYKYKFQCNINSNHIIEDKRSTLTECHFQDYCKFQRETGSFLVILSCQKSRKNVVGLRYKILHIANPLKAFIV